MTLTVTLTLMLLFRQELVAKNSWRLGKQKVRDQIGEGNVPVGELCGMIPYWSSMLEVSGKCGNEIRYSQ